MPTYAPSIDDFMKDSIGAKVTVLKEDGLYRHLRVSMANGPRRWYDIVTWPGNLLITGDVGTYTFQRVPDMFEFFRAPADINPYYWMEKVVDGRDRCMEFSWDKFLRQLREDVYSRIRDKDHADTVWMDIDDALIGTEHDEYGAVQFAREYEFYSTEFGDFSFSLVDMPDPRKFTYDYIWCCRAIRLAISGYDSMKESE